jgi:predicted  nucleic acid-binding Zn-ribbon protein
VNNKQHQIDELREKIENQNKEISSLYKVIADLKTTVETLSGTVLHLQEQTSLIQKKITKQPTIIHDKCFISGRESSGI